ncbi:hypothetical protein [Hydrogenophaga sp.]|uniref:hypothetical protein n=1 Tax=Hydrogenophaga sp. TaxID=1904254 RepID=UPI0035693BF7
MGEESKPATGAEVPGEQPNKVDLRAEVLDISNRVYRLLKDAPWVGLGAVLTAMGAAILYFYFQSIDYVPPDLTSVIAASAAVAALAFAFMLLMALFLIAPRLGFQSSRLSEATKATESARRLWGLDWLLVACQLIGPGGFLLFVAFRMWSDCKVGWMYAVTPGVVFFLFGLVGWIREERKERCSFTQRVKRFGRSLWVAFWSVFPFIALFWFLIPQESVQWLDLIMLLLVWLCMVYVNAGLTRELPVWVLAFVGFMLLPALLISVPTFLGRPSLFPTRVAELSGIRDQIPSELRIPKSTCSLIQSGFEAGQTSADLICDTGSEWGSVKAQVLSNLGDRWLIEVFVDAGGKPGGGGSLRITIPGEGVQTVRRMVPKAESSASCNPWPWGKS